MLFCVGTSERCNSGQYFKENIMGLLEELAGAAIAVEGAKKLDPDAGIFTEGAAAVAGYVGVEKVTEHFEDKDNAADGSDQSS